MRSSTALRCVEVAGFVGVLSLAQMALAVPRFVGLGDLPGGNFASGGYEISADGSTAVGASNSTSGGEAYRWTPSEGIVGLGDLPGSSFGSGASGVSSDGSVIVGLGSSASGVGTTGYNEAYRWTAGDGMVGLGDLPGGGFSSYAIATSADGSVVVGVGEGDQGSEAFRWTSDGGMVGLGDLPGGGFESVAQDVSADGSVVVGWGASPSGYGAFSWTLGGGMVGLGDLPGGETRSKATAVSADGLVVVGQGSSSSGLRAVRWTPGEGVASLGGFAGYALGVSADGSTIVGGASFSLSSSEAFIWDSEHGMRSLIAVLTNDYGLGLEVSGWTLQDARAVSDDGRTIVGFGRNPSGFREGWLAEVPEPSTEWLLGSGLVGLAALGRRRLARGEGGEG